MLRDGFRAASRFGCAFVARRGRVCWVGHDASVAAEVPGLHCRVPWPVDGAGSGELGCRSLAFCSGRYFLFVFGVACVAACVDEAAAGDTGG